MAAENESNPSNLGYGLEGRTFSAGPTQDEKRYASYAVICVGPEQPIRPEWAPFPHVGPERLFVARWSEVHGAPGITFAQPLLAEARGDDSLPKLGRVGIDSRVYTDKPSSLERSESPEHPAPEPGPVLEQGPREEPVRDGHIRVAVLDSDCKGYGVLGVDALAYPKGDVPFPGFPRPIIPPPPEESDPLGHGVIMAMVVRSVAPQAHLGLFQVGTPDEEHLSVADLAAAIADAAGRWNADVIVISMARASWGAPPYLRTLLRQAARKGRGGRGTAIFCATGRPAQYGSQERSDALPGDALASQPWVFAIAACDERARVYRNAGLQALGTLGPSVELSAAGDKMSYGSRGSTADDTSQACALSAGAAVLALERNPELTVGDLRLLLRMTADRPATIEESRAIPSSTLEHASRDDIAYRKRFLFWDHSGHNFKLGHGRTNPGLASRAAEDPVCYALMATREPTYPPPAFGDVVPPPDCPPVKTPLALEMANAWTTQLERNAEHPVCQRYLSLRPRLVRVLIRAPALQDALYWMVRHLRALRTDGGYGWPDQAEVDDHGVLLDRLDYLLDVLREEVRRTPGSEELSAWADELQSLAHHEGDGAVAGFLAVAVGISQGNPVRSKSLAVSS